MIPRADIFFGAWPTLGAPACAGSPHRSSKLRSGEIIAGLVSSTVAIPLAMAFGMFAFVSLGDEYFAYGAMAGLISAVVAGVASVVLGDRSTRIYAPRITTTFFLGLLLHSLLHRDPADAVPDVSATLLVFFAIVLLGGLLQALFGLMRFPLPTTLCLFSITRKTNLSHQTRSQTGNDGWAIICQANPTKTDYLNSPLRVSYLGQYQPKIDPRCGPRTR